jgi:N-acetyl-gamma-glutamyl-phosphate reductase
MAQQLQCAVVGATGYAGFELTRLLLRHPRAAQPLLLGRHHEFKNEEFKNEEIEGDAAKLRLDELYPHIANGNGGYPLKPFSWEAMEKAGVELLFMATPHETSREWIPEAIRRGLRVIDLSGAWRLERPEHRAVYGFADADAATAAELTAMAVYGLPELHRTRIAAAQLVANPGCYATSVILALAPLVKAKVIELETGIICDSKSGVSGAGKQATAKTHFVEVNENLSAYNVFSHRHNGEMLEQLALEASQLTFTPHLLPIARGILSTIYVRLKQARPAAEIERIYREFLAASPWVRIFAAGKLPQIQYSARTNFCDIGFTLGPDGRRLVIVSCLDNLLKGAAGQAVQNMNVMFGFSETEGLN